MEENKQIETNKIYEIVGQLTLQLWQAQETIGILTQQVRDLNEQLRISSTQQQVPTETSPQNMSTAQAIQFLQQKGIPISIDGQNLPSMDGEKDGTNK